MKAVLVIDMPENCWDCEVHSHLTCAKLMKTISVEGKLEDCPLKTLPKMIPYKKGEATRIKWHDIGYNNCVRELLGESWKMEGETE